MTRQRACTRSHGRSFELNRGIHSMTKLRFCTENQIVVIQSKGDHPPIFTGRKLSALK